MTRFMMTLPQAMELVMYAFKNGKNGDLFVQKAPSASLNTLTDALKDIFDKPNHPINVIGTRHGEKLYETLLSREEMACAKNLGNYFRVPPDFRDLNYGNFIEKGRTNVSLAEDYNSLNSKQLNRKQMQALLRTLDYIKSIERGICTPRGMNIENHYNRGRWFHRQRSKILSVREHSIRNYYIHPPK